MYTHYAADPSWSSPKPKKPDQPPVPTELPPTKPVPEPQPNIPAPPKTPPEIDLPKPPTPGKQRPMA